jgi:hypothetical protein
MNNANVKGVNLNGGTTSTTAFSLHLPAQHLQEPSTAAIRRSTMPLVRQA